MQRSKPKELPPVEELHRLFSYDSEHGLLIRKVTISPKAKTGDVAGYKKQSGYWSVRVNYDQYPVHRIIYAMHHGPISTDVQIDHIDCNRSNNKIDNLRAATHSQNSHNVRRLKTNTSGVKGVSWNSWHKKWRVDIRKDNKLLLEYFTTKEDAIAFAEANRVRMHGEYTNHGNGT